MALLRRAEGPRSDTPLTVDPAKCRLTKEFPELTEFLSRERWEDGSERECGSMMMVFDNGHFKCWLNDKDAGLQLWVSGDTPWKALEKACKALTQEGGDWRAPRPSGGKKRK